MTAICHACGCITQTDSNTFKMLKFIDPASSSISIINTYEDHRISMSVNLLKLKFPFLRPDNSSCIEKSFPGFLRELKKVSKPAT
jgi:5-enolpyruvylshikimate-3-phosphate synthase